MNSYFQFKQFTIQQDKCAMKVCTDACLFGAWVANKLVSEKINPINILDIGTGTGLLTLMLAQKINTKIVSVEIDTDAYLQAKENIENSEYKNNIIIQLADITTTNFNEKFDCIICNPPFFENQLQTNNAARNAAMHATTLSYIELAKVIQKNITENGNAFLLLPHYALQDFEKILATENLYVNNIVQINHSALHNYFRVIFMISKKEKIKDSSEISIKDENQNYSEIFIDLLNDYYLYL